MKARVGGCALIALAGCVESTMPLGFEPRDRDAAARDAGAGPRKDAAVEDAGSPNDDAGSPNEEAYAAYLAHCARETETYLNLAAACSGTTPAELSASGWRWDACTPSIGAGIRSGALSFDPVGAAQCLALTRAMGCSNFSNDEGTLGTPVEPIWDWPCPHFITGTRQEGERCGYGECRRGLVCEIADDACVGVCRASTVRVARLGETCQDGTQEDISCETGTFCGRSADASKWTCLPWPREVGDPCRSNCPLPMYCSEHRCALQFPLGAECVASGQGGDTCEGETVDCSGSFEAGYRCGERRKLGESCVPGIRECWWWFFCDQVSPSEGVCRFPLQLGERCIRGAEAHCPEGSYCPWYDDPDPVCTKVRPNGSACRYHNECERSLCDEGICTPSVPAPPPPLECP
ncbi:MAG: hypothetical protein IT384_10845 [Deltaproteobacteria bacterium]|nr:hypothetical protein [Deltaproteobacteria bacterium]